MRSEAACEADEARLVRNGRLVSTQEIAQDTAFVLSSLLHWLDYFLSHLLTFVLTVYFRLHFILHDFWKKQRKRQNFWKFFWKVLPAVFSKLSLNFRSFETLAKLILWKFEDSEKTPSYLLQYLDEWLRNTAWVLHNSCLNRGKTFSSCCFVLNFKRPLNHTQIPQMTLIKLENKVQKSIRKKPERRKLTKPRLQLTLLQRSSNKVTPKLHQSTSYE